MDTANIGSKFPARNNSNGETSLMYQTSMSLLWEKATMWTPPSSTVSAPTVECMNVSRLQKVQEISDGVEDGSSATSNSMSRRIEEMTEISIEILECYGRPKEIKKNSLVPQVDFFKKFSRTVVFSNLCD